MALATIDTALYGNDPEMVENFVLSAKELLDEIETSVLDLKKVPESERDALVNHVFRAAHTIKGESSFVSLHTIGKLAHTIENVLDRVRDGLLPVSDGLVNTLLDGFDRLRGLVENVEVSETQNISADLTALNRFLQGSVAPEESSVSVRDSDDSAARPAGVESASPEWLVDECCCGPIIDRVRVLVVDDEPVVLKGVAKALKDAGIQVDLAATSSLAIRAMMRSLYNVVICDLHLGEENGLELIPQLKAISPLVQAIVLTGDANLVTVVQSLEAGAIEFVPKSRIYDDLALLVKDALSRVDRWTPLLTE